MVNPQLIVSRAIADFANDLSNRLAAESNASFAISPTSIVAALGMALKIVHPDKKRAFLQTLGFGAMTEDEAHRAIGASLRAMALPENFSQGTIEIAQGFVRKPWIEVSEALPQFLKEAYDAELIISENLMDSVNEWANAKTHGKIPTILSDNESDLVLLNAIYLAFKWRQPFEKPAFGWAVEQFTFADGTAALVSMMTQTKRLSLYQGERFDLLEKPYVSPEGRKLSQLVFLPHDPKELLSIEKELTDETIRTFRQKTVRQEVELSMPKIKMESAFSLLDLFKEMGLPLEDLDADLLQTEEARISGILHKTFVATDEAGTEAAAVTAVLVECCMAIGEPKQFKMDHSYSYFLMDGDTVLFRGRVADKTPLVVD